MKLWEVIKELTDDPTKKFERKDQWKHWVMRTDVVGGAISGGTYYFMLDCHGEDIYGDAGGFHGNLTNNEDDWHLVRQPVTWQEAIQAWEKGNKVTVEFDSVGGPVKRVKVPFSDTISVSRTEIIKGTWYVED